VIDAVDWVLRESIVAAMPGLATRIGFQRPDDGWIQRLGSSQGVWLNCYLVDLREDRHRRSNDTWVRPAGNGFQRRHAPFRVRCQYLLSAWNPAKDSDQVRATEQEHSLLGSVVQALVEAAPLRPAAVLTPADLALVPAEWHELSLDTDILPPDGFAKLAEFWGTMGRPAPWRPVAVVVITVPLPTAGQSVDGIVQAVVTSIGDGVPLPGAVEELADVGGVVLDASGAHAAVPVPVPGALVTANDPAGGLAARVTAGSDGRFVLDGLRPGTYSVLVRAAGLPTPAAVLTEVPPDTGAVLELRIT
jgi:Pvc16 N-terminal domain/Carboxypeptidase regulatory-like domain